MVRFVFRRIFASLVTFFALIVLTFLLLRLAPGGPFDSDRAWPVEIQEHILKKYGLNEPLLKQLSLWVRDLVHGNLHQSFQYLGRPVTEIIANALPASVAFGSLALLLSLLIGIPLGVLAAWKRNTGWDVGILITSVSWISLPSYLTAALLIWIFSMKLGWFPPALWESGNSMVLPVVTLSLKPMAIVVRLTRSSMLETLHSDYIRTARAKGAPERKVFFHHALRNSLIPVLTVFGPLTASLITGSFLVEYVFQIPGMGRYFVSSILNRDYPLAMGMTLVYGSLLIAANLLVDLAYGMADPRMKV